MDVKIVLYEPRHWIRFNIRAEDDADLNGIPMRDIFNGTNLLCWRTVLIGSDPAFFFKTELEDGVGTINAITSPLVDQIPLLITRLGRSKIKRLFEQGAHRVEAYCHAGNERSLRWLTRSLGMTIEGLMRQSGPNAQDRYLLSILPGEVHY